MMNVPDDKASAARIAALLEKSSFGTPAARAARERTPLERAQRIAQIVPDEKTEKAATVSLGGAQPGATQVVPLSSARAASPTKRPSFTRSELAAAGWFDDVMGRAVAGYRWGAIAADIEQSAMWLSVQSGSGGAAWISEELIRDNCRAFRSYPDAVDHAQRVLSAACAANVFVGPSEYVAEFHRDVLRYTSDPRGPTAQAGPLLYMYCAANRYGDQNEHGLPSLDPEEYLLRRARLNSEPLSQVFVQSPFDFDYISDGALLIRGVEEVGSAGRALVECAEDDAITRMTVAAHTTALLLVAAIAGQVGYRAQHGGHICQCVITLPAVSELETSMRSGELLVECLTGHSFDPSAGPDYIALACLRGEPQAIASVMSARTLQQHLPQWAVKLLWDRRFRTRDKISDEIRGPIAVLAGSSEDPVITYHEGLMWSESPHHQEALNRVKDVWAHHRSQVALARGDILVIDNSRAVHHRTWSYPS